MTTRRRRPWLWLVMAAVLLGLGGWLMRGAEPPPRPPPPDIRMPTAMNRAEAQRAETRRVWAAPVVVEPDAGVLPAAPKPRDPVLALMPSEVKRVAVVGEFNALMNSELGPDAVRCFFGEDDGKDMAWLRDAGIDPKTQVDRIMVLDDVVVMTGALRDAHVRDDLVETRQYGAATISVYQGLHDEAPFFVGKWNGQVMLFSPTEAAVKARLDVLLGTTPPAANPVIGESAAYGELYGVVSPNELVGRLFQGDQRLAELVKQTASSIELHADLSHDLGLSAQVTAEDPAKAEELRRSLGGALSLLRMQAEAKGQREQAQVLDLAKVGAASGDVFELQAGLPHELMRDALKACIERRRQDGR